LDSFNGFGGLATSCLNLIKEEFPKKGIFSFLSFPDFKMQPKDTQMTQLINTETLDAFKQFIEIKKSDQQTIFEIISAIMHLGNVKIVNEQPNESSCIDLNDFSIQKMCGLLKIDELEMRTWLCNKRIKTVTDLVNTPLPLCQAIFLRDALAKHMYSQLFNWIVRQINKCLKSPVKTHLFIGLLDIYGFESFEINSFEQFCINYANEKLQQQFYLHVFKLEQEEYLKEQIKLSFIEFYDDQPCIELIDGKLGIMELLDEECKMPKGSDLTWCNKLYDKNLKQEIEIKNRIQHHFSKQKMSSKAFLIHHFAERVEYQVDGFLEKNHDVVHEELLKILKSSDVGFIADLFIENKSKEAPPKTQVKTVGSQFRESLNNLMIVLNSTTPHFVRCIKPNDLKAPFKFQSKRAVVQLRACGILETVRISAAGYPSHLKYQEFFQRYSVLFKPKLIDHEAFKETGERVLLHLFKGQNKYQFGKTEIFFQAGQLAYLEKLRYDKLKAYSIIIQKNIRGWLARSKYIKIKRSAILIQQFGRGLLVRNSVKFKREIKEKLLPTKIKLETGYNIDKSQEFEFIIKWVTNRIKLLKK
jgi:myosin-5